MVHVFAFAWIRCTRSYLLFYIVYAVLRGRANTSSLHHTCRVAISKRATVTRAFRFTSLSIFIMKLSRGPIWVTGRQFRSKVDSIYDGAKPCWARIRFTHTDYDFRYRNRLTQKSACQNKRANERYLGYHRTTANVLIEKNHSIKLDEFAFENRNFAFRAQIVFALRQLEC